MVIPNQYFETPQYKVERIKLDEAVALSHTPSYELPVTPEPPITTQIPTSSEVKQPAVRELDIATTIQPPQKTKLFKRLLDWVKKKLSSSKQTKQSTPHYTKRKHHQHRHKPRHYGRPHHHTTPHAAKPTTVAEEKVSITEVAESVESTPQATTGERKQPYRRHYRGKRRRHSKPQTTNNV